MAVQFDEEIHKRIEEAGFRLYKLCNCSGIHRRKYGERGIKEVWYMPTKNYNEYHAKKTIMRRGREAKLFGFIKRVDQSALNSLLDEIK